MACCGKQKNTPIEGSDSLIRNKILIFLVLLGIWPFLPIVGFWWIFFKNDENKNGLKQKWFSPDTVGSENGDSGDSVPEDRPK